MMYVNKTPKSARRPRVDSDRVENGDIGESLFSLLSKMFTDGLLKVLISDLMRKSSKHFLLLFIAFINFWRQFHQHFTYKFLVQMSFQQLSSSYMYVEKAAETMLVQKICT